MLVLSGFNIRNKGLTERMLENQKIKDLLIFESVTGITIIGNHGNFTLGCDDGLGDNETIRKFFKQYNDLIDNINEFYDYKKLEKEWSNGNGQIFFNFDDFASYSCYKQGESDNEENKSKYRRTFE